MATDKNINYSLLDKDTPITVLAVEDDATDMAFLEIQINALGHHIIKAVDGAQAISILDENRKKIDVILMDRMMPVMNGITAVKRIKDDPELRNVPIVMVTGADSAEQMKEGLDAGVFYYLTKPVNEDMLRSVLSAAVRESTQTKTLAEELGKHRSSFNLIDTCKFKFSTLSDAESLAAFMANCFADPEKVLLGLGELLINAIEHGNIGIGYERKTGFVQAGTWRAEVERLQQLPQFVNKTATATIAHKDDGTYVVIEDQGDGFAWQKFMQIDPARAGDNHGRGIAQANTISFDKLSYNDKGNKAIAFVSHAPRLEW